MNGPAHLPGDLDFDKSNEILFRLGIIYKQRSKYSESLQCFDQILRNPPIPLAHADIWFQIGHVYEQQGDVRFTGGFFFTLLTHAFHIAQSGKDGL
jgi:tetratricopeptide (TPR) repeat protein